MNKTSLTAMALATLLGAAALPAAARTDAQISINLGPPPARYEAVPAPRRGSAWTPGYWDWRGQRHVWVPGTWVRERSGYRYAQPQWVNHNGRWILVRGYLAQGGRDADRDGIPNRYDRDRDGDGVANRNDRDRDGDGVPNRRDARPDNPNRR